MVLNVVSWSRLGLHFSGAHDARQKLTSPIFPRIIQQFPDIKSHFVLSILLLVCDVPHLTTSSAMTTQQLILFLLFALLRPMPTWSMTTKEMNTVDWFNLIRYLFGLGFVIFGATSLLYSHLSTYLLLQKYKSTGKTISVQVLSCEENNKP